MFPVQELSPLIVIDPSIFWLESISGHMEAGSMLHAVGSPDHHSANTARQTTAPSHSLFKIN